MISPICVSRHHLALVALALYLVLATGGCARRATPPANGTPPPPPAVEHPPAPLVQPPMPAAQPTAGHRYPTHVYHVEGPGVQRLAADFGPAHLSQRRDYWLIGSHPVTIEVRFAEPLPYPADELRRIRQALGEAIIHEQGYEAGRVFLRASLPPGRHVVYHISPGLVLDRGQSFRLMYWAPGKISQVLGEYVLPHVPLPVAPRAEREKAFFSTILLDDGCAGVYVCLWRWQPTARQPLMSLPGVWPWARILPRGDDLVIEDFRSLRVADSDLQSIAALVEDRQPYGTAVGPGGEIAVFLLQENGRGELYLDLNIFSANLEAQQEWAAIYRHGRFNDGIPRVEPIWHGDEILFLALDDHRPGRPTYNVMAFCITTGTVQHLLGPFERALRIGPTHYVLGGGVLFDAVTRSSWSLPSSTELGLQSPVSLVAVNGEWMVFQQNLDPLHWSPELLVWHPAAGPTALGPGERAFAMGEGFGWWTETPYGSR